MTTGFAAPRPPTDPRAELFRRQAQSNEALWRNLQSRTANLPIAQTEQAVAAALRFQGQRQYQRMLDAGIPAHEALARSAPLMFAGPRQSSLGQAAQFMRASTPAQKYHNVGGVLYLEQPDGTVKAVTGPVAPKAPPRPIVVGGVAYDRTPDGRLTPLTKPASKLTETQKALLAADVTELKGLEKQIGGTEEHGFGPLHPFGGNKAQLDALRKKADDLRTRIRKEYGGAAQSVEAINVPRNTQNRVKGQTYRTPKGLYTWTGTGWRAAPPGAEEPQGQDAAAETEDNSDAE